MQMLTEGRQEKLLEVINLGTGNGVSVKEAVDAFQAVNDVELPHQYGPRRPGDIVAVYADCAKAEKVLGWKANRSLEEMMRTAWAWQQHLSS